MTKELNSFIKQTSIDYGIPCWKVKEVYEKWGLDNFYSKLEELVKDETDWEKCNCGKCNFNTEVV